MINPDKYKILHSREAAGGYGSIGIKIMVGSTPEIDLKNEVLQSAAYDMVNNLKNEITALIYANDQAAQEMAKKEREELLGLFPNKIYVRDLPNGYCKEGCCRHLPWFEITTPKGIIVIGWRKRVINIDWSNTVGTKTAEQLFPKEDVTKGDKYIHAWTIPKAQEYIDLILA